KECVASVSAMELSMWFETALLRLSMWYENMDIRTGATIHEGCSAIFLAFNQEIELSEEQIDILLQMPESTMFEEESFGVHGIWVPEQNKILGVIR
ncbi:MAG: hypothetical protein WC252_01790, partial [Candidatus Cloacimonadaceae bacterium]